MTLFVNKAPIAGTSTGTLTWGAAQAGVAGGVADAVSEGILSEADADQSLIIAAVWVIPPQGRRPGLREQPGPRPGRRCGPRSRARRSMAEVLAARTARSNPSTRRLAAAGAAAGGAGEGLAGSCRAWRGGGGQEPAGGGADEGGPAPGIRAT
jgi:5,6,7,8-tetrahydromethanopterin hydro-lyase